MLFFLKGQNNWGKKKAHYFLRLVFTFFFFFFISSPRASVFAHSSEQLLGHKDSQRESLTLLDAKELLKYFTPEGLPVGDLQPLQIPKRYDFSILKLLKTIFRSDVGE